ncbi:MAG: hypothetical protein RLZZ324_428 [Candidatus Parcubacteria bacterium]|jgi:hypothetical protein
MKRNIYPLVRIDRGLKKRYTVLISESNLHNSKEHRELLRTLSGSFPSSLLILLLTFDKNKKQR